ncbi:hypothetical protein AAFF_G00390440 [Aldrovandia affinis]|uniref:Uncharacterized protein n=1 Tax=Aldrovandia affinis TaxID=143900 RepID=A0AAD7SEF5_9TELE|nr:hypothetical protein AAFF_G00390440 [Aldrovandia affinis]
MPSTLPGDPGVVAVKAGVGEGGELRGIDRDAGRGHRTLLPGSQPRVTVSALRPASERAACQESNAAPRTDFVASINHRHRAETNVLP